MPSTQPRAINVHRPELGMFNAYHGLHPLKHPERVIHRGLGALEMPTLGEGFHTLRRSRARHLYDVATAAGSRTAIRIVQAQIGHRSQATTEIYLGLTSDQIDRDELLRFKRFMQ